MTEELKRALDFLLPIEGYVSEANSSDAPSPDEAPSSYLPGTSIRFAWDSTCLGAFKTCPRYYQYTILEGWAGKDESIHLRFGIEYHQALHDYEKGLKAGAAHDDALFDCIRELLLRCANYPAINAESRPSIKVKTKANLVRTVVWYLDQFADDPAETFVREDGSPAMEVSFKFELDWGPEQSEVYPVDNDMLKLTNGDPNKTFQARPYLLCGHLDRVVSFNDEIFVMDRKTTTGSLTDYYYAQFEPNNQMTLYTIAGQVVLGTSLKGVIIDAACVQVGGTVYGRRFTYRTQDQLDEWMRDLRETLAQAERYATEGYWPMNDTACDKFGGCRFRGVCSKSPGVRNAFLKADFVQLEESKRWNPLRNR